MKKMKQLMLLSITTALFSCSPSPEEIEKQAMEFAKSVVEPYLQGKLPEEDFYKFESQELRDNMNYQDARNRYYPKTKLESYENGFLDSLYSYKITERFSYKEIDPVSKEESTMYVFFSEFEGAYAYVYIRYLEDKKEGDLFRITKMNHTIYGINKTSIKRLRTEFKSKR